jgi:hypothetical protein
LIQPALSRSLFLHARGALSARRVTEAYELLNEAELLGHNPDECAAQRWICCMLMGHLEGAWEESDRIQERGRQDPHRFWDGRPFSGRRVLIRCLHGFGDAIQFIRFAALIRHEADEVIAQTHPELVSLLGCAEGVDRVVTWSSDSSRDVTGWDQQIEVMELPRAFRLTLANIPNHVPYLHIQRVPAGRSKIGVTNDRMCVALQWGSSAYNPARSMHLSELVPILRMRHLNFYTFQRDEARSQLQSLPSSLSIEDIGGDSPEILDTAQQLAEVDLLITVDTMLAHLGGALGKPVWLMLPFEADWRWMLDRADSPWYPTMRIFRQRSPGDWGTVVQEVASELASYGVHANSGTRCVQR